MSHDDLEPHHTGRPCSGGVINGSDWGFKTAKTINDTDFAALRAVFGWGVKSGWLSANPAENARIEGRGKKRTREPWFLDHERAAILNAALAVQGSKREKRKTTSAKRWVPWLCAYSGARVVEMIQLRKEDVRREQDGWIIHLNPKPETPRPTITGMSPFMSI